MFQYGNERSGVHGQAYLLDPSCSLCWGRDRRRPEISGQHVGTCEPNVGLGQGALRDHSDQKTLRTSRNKGPNKPNKPNHQHAKLTSLPETQKKSGRNATPPFTNNHVSLPKPGPSHSCHRHHGHGLTHKWRA